MIPEANPLNPVPTDENDRRRNRRFEMDLPGLITCEECLSSGAATPWKQGRTRDISCDGVYFFCTRPFPEASRVKVSILVYIPHMGIPGGVMTQIQAEGKVVRADNHGMAVHFTRGTRLMPITGRLGVYPDETSGEEQAADRFRTWS